jgi:hypothetical protein
LLKKITKVINLNLTIRNPWSDRFEIVVSGGKKITQNKAWEFEIYRSDTVVELETRLTIREDHAGVMLGFGLLSWTVRAQIYDTRHWDYEAKKWVQYD